MKTKLIIGLIMTGTLSACATGPIGPTVAVMPARGKPFEVFAQEEQQCRAYAAQLSGASTQNPSASVAGTAVAGTVLGAAAGALLGGNHNAAGVGAGVGLLAGTAVGSSGAKDTGGDVQYRYNLAYTQCMYAKGNQVPAPQETQAIEPTYVIVHQPPRMHGPIYPPFMP